MKILNNTTDNTCYQFISKEVDTGCSEKGYANIKGTVKRLIPRKSNLQKAPPRQVSHLP